MYSICRSCKGKAVKYSSKVGNALHAMEQWPQNANLVFNAKKTKSMLFSICKMLQHHQLY